MVSVKYLFAVNIELQQQQGYLQNSRKDIFIKLFKVRLNIFPIVEVQSILVWISLVFAKKTSKKCDLTIGQRFA